MSTTQDTQKDNSFVEARKQTEEYKRLQEARNPETPWKKWGPYLSDRQWATVREDYSLDGSTWRYFDYEQSRSRAYRWGEDGIFGISDDRQRLCFSLTLWNGKDDHLKERFFGLTGLFGGDDEGNHMEDIKEYYFYLDNTPTHSYMKALYKYPYKFPYEDLREKNRQRRDAKYNRGEEHPEYELIDTGCFDNNSYFDVVIEYAKKTPEDILIKITVWNRGSEAHLLHILPTLWFRNTWSWSGDAEKEKQKPYLQKVANNVATIKAHHSELGDYYLYYQDCQGDPDLLFTENETNNASPYVKDGINNYVVYQQKDKVNPEYKGTKASAHYPLNVNVENPEVIGLRLTNIAPEQLSNSDPFGSDFEEVFDKRKKEADAFYQAITPLDFKILDEERQIQRQAFAGMLWNKQFYYYIVQDWLKGDWSYQDRKWHKIYPPHDLPDKTKSATRKFNSEWTHLHNEDIISMPDKWEYPNYAVWDSAFHAVTLALIDPDFAKEQLSLFLEEWYIHSNGQIPSFEWNFSEGNPPVHAWGAWQVYQIEQDMYGFSDKDFLRKIFHKLNSNFNWWLEVQKIPEKNLFSGGFLGLDNISLINRSQFKTGDVKIEQADGTSWMAMFCLNMLRIAIELGSKDSSPQDKETDEIATATKFLKEFLNIANAINDITEKNRTHLWDQKDEFYYDILSIVQKNLTLEFPLKYRSLVGLIPLFAVDIFESKINESSNKIIDAFKSQFFKPNSLSTLFLPETDFNYLIGKYESFYITDKSNDNNLEMYLSIVDFDKLQLIVKKLLDKQEFLSDYGIRSLSKIHDPNSEFGAAYSIPCFMKDMYKNVLPSKILYEPGEAGYSPVHTGNSNWRGPIWFPMNFLIVDSLYKFHRYIHDCLGDEFKVEFPTGERGRNTLKQVAIEISKRLIRIFLPDWSGKRPVYGDNPKLRDLFKTPDGQDLILFYEYFNGDTGQGLGASHQTGWTGLVANLIHQVAEYEYKEDKEAEKVAEKVQEIPQTTS
jgi:hypothetical protein